MINHEDIKQLRKQLQAAILETWTNEPQLTIPEVAAMYGVSLTHVNKLTTAAGLHRKRGPKPTTIRKKPVVPDVV